MIYIRKFKSSVNLRDESLASWHSVSEEEALRNVRSGVPCWDRAAIPAMFDKGFQLTNAFAIYRKVSEAKAKELMGRL